MRRAPPLDHGDRAAFVGGRNLYQPEVDQLDRAVGRQLDVGGLDVAMQHERLLGVEVVHRAGDLPCPVQHVAFGQKIPSLGGLREDLP